MTDARSIPDPALFAAADPVLGAIRWQRWEPGLATLCANLPVDCTTCGDPGPGSYAHGLTFQHEPARREILTRSNVVEGRRPTSRPVPALDRWIISHYASRCVACDETFVYRMASSDPEGLFTELEEFYQPPRRAKGRHGRRAKALPQPDSLF